MRAGRAVRAHTQGGHARGLKLEQQEKLALHADNVIRFP